MLRSRSHAGSASNLKRELAAERAQRQRMAQLLTELARLLTTGAKLPPLWREFGAGEGALREGEQCSFHRPPTVGPAFERI